MKNLLFVLLSIGIFSCRQDCGCCPGPYPFLFSVLNKDSVSVLTKENIVDLEVRVEKNGKTSRINSFDTLTNSKGHLVVRPKNLFSQYIVPPENKFAIYLKNKSIATIDVVANGSCGGLYTSLSILINGKNAEFISKNASVVIITD